MLLKRMLASQITNQLEANILPLEANILSLRTHIDTLIVSRPSIKLQTKYKATQEQTKKLCMQASVNN